jgi:hypothetical protein
LALAGLAASFGTLDAASDIPRDAMWRKKTLVVFVLVF